MNFTQRRRDSLFSEARPTCAPVYIKKEWGLYVKCPHDGHQTRYGVICLALQKLKQ